MEIPRNLGRIRPRLRQRALSGRAAARQRDLDGHIDSPHNRRRRIWLREQFRQGGQRGDNASSRLGCSSRACRQTKKQAGARARARANKALTKDIRDVEASSPATPLGRHGKGSATPTALGKFDAHKPGSGLLSARATPTSNASSDEAQLEELRSMVPLDAEGKPTSIGTMKHEAGLCKPCVFFPSVIGCSNGITCLFCHITHARAQRRQCKNKRERYKKLIDSQVAFHLNGQQEVA
mmetsp:Transcript_41547/g.131501  ORF Transcript_41547/g.131501 Transcript_41547/m.131501 type:complete len:237 (+) Transcript_41547:138-848(+)